MPNESIEDEPQQAESHCLVGGVIGKIPLAQLEDGLLQNGLAFWQGLCRDRKYPMRSDVTLRGLKSLMRNTILVRVIGEGEDYEYRFVGDAHVVAHGQSVQGRRWNDLAAENSVYTRQRRQFYDEVTKTGLPVAFGGFVVQHFFAPPTPRERVFLHSRTLCLPLGRTEAAVDHILTFTVYDNRISGDLSRIEEA